MFNWSFLCDLFRWSFFHLHLDWFHNFLDFLLLELRCVNVRSFRRVVERLARSCAIIFNDFFIRVDLKIVFGLRRVGFVVQFGVQTHDCIFHFFIFFEWNYCVDFGFSSDKLIFVCFIVIVFNRHTETFTKQSSDSVFRLFL